MGEFMEFFSSLRVIGWIVLVLVVLILLNIGKIFRLRSPLDSQDQKLWRETSGSIGGSTKPEHLERKTSEQEHLARKKS